MTDSANTHATKQAVLPLLLRINEVCSLLNMSRRSLLKYEADGRFGPARIFIGKMVQYRREEVEAWVRAGCPCREHWRAMKKA